VRKWLSVESSRPPPGGGPLAWPARIDRSEGPGIMMVARWQRDQQGSSAISCGCCGATVLAAVCGCRSYSPESACPSQGITGRLRGASESAHLAPKVTLRHHMYGGPNLSVMSIL
jgi:hypothetical protein